MGDYRVNFGWRGVLRPSQKIPGDVRGRHRAVQLRVRDDRVEQRPQHEQSSAALAAPQSSNYISSAISVSQTVDVRPGQLMVCDVKTRGMVLDKHGDPFENPPSWRGRLI